MGPHGLPEYLGDFETSSTTRSSPTSSPGKPLYAQNYLNHDEPKNTPHMRRPLREEPTLLLPGRAGLSQRALGTREWDQGRV